MTKSSLRAVALLCSTLVATHAQSAPYQLTSHVSGVADYFNIYNLGFGDLSDWSGHTLFDITYRATVDYAGSGAYSSAQRIPVEVSISINGRPTEISTINGWFSVSQVTDAGKSYLQQYFSVYATPSSFGSGFTFAQRVEFPGAAAADPGSLPFNVPLTASSGQLDYSMYTATDVGDMYWGGASGQVNAMSFTLAPVPEPSGWAMLGAGLVLTGAIARRRRVRSA